MLFMDVKERIFLLRKYMKENEIDAYLVLSYDSHISEYSQERFNTREFITGFTGSSGIVIVTASETVLFVDGRYFLQAQVELSGTEIKLIKLGIKGYPSFFEYININLKGLKFGIYSEEINIRLYQNLLKYCKNTCIKFLDENLIDKIWDNRPDLKCNNIFELVDVEKNNKRSEKLISIYSELKEHSVDFYVISSLEEIAWVLNLRGSDIENSALFYSFLFLSKKLKHKNVLFIDIEKLDVDLKKRLEIEGFKIEFYSNFYLFLNQIKDSGKFFVSLDSNVRIFKILGEENIGLLESIISTLKARKTDYEILKMKEAHILDSISLIKFLYKFKSLNKSELSKMDEIDVAEILLSFRILHKEFFSSSFESIVGFRGNSALPHYRPKRGTKLENDGLILVDSGGSYIGLGTTDTTRVFLIGNVSNEERRDYTLVLKSFISLASLKFPYGSLGSFLDGIARLPLLKNELNFMHGTGHGIGFFLNVHELPVSINPNSDYSFKGSEVVTIEPGIYRASKYGIRLENVVFVKQSISNEFGSFLEFENLTLVPFERELILKEMLSDDELRYINSYHDFIFSTLKKYFDSKELEFLKKLTSKI